MQSFEYMPTKRNAGACFMCDRGNWIGQIPYLTGPACTQCSSGQLYCNNGLCDGEWSEH